MKNNGAILTQEHILRVANEVFSEKGYYNTKTKEIAERVGVSEALVFKYFKNKDSLYAATFHWQLRQLMQLAPSGKKDPMKELYLFSSAFIFPENEKNKYACLLNNMMRMQQEYNISHLYQIGDAEKEVITPLIKEAQETGMFIDGDPGSYAHIIWKFTSGAATSIVNYPKSFTLQDLEMFFALFRK